MAKQAGRGAQRVPGGQRKKGVVQSGAVAREYQRCEALVPGLRTESGVEIKRHEAAGGCIPIGKMGCGEVPLGGSCVEKMGMVVFGKPIENASEDAW